MGIGSGPSLCLLILWFVICAPIAIADLTYSFKYTNNDFLCNNDNTGMNPVGWLYVDGIVGVCMSGLILLTAILYPCMEEISVIPTSITLALVSMFQFAWCIIGGVMLWRDNMQCSPNNFHDYLWASVLIKIILVIRTMIWMGTMCE